jgi:hypothetical protein
MSCRHELVPQLLRPPISAYPRESNDFAVDWFEMSTGRGPVSRAHDAVAGYRVLAEQAPDRYLGDLARALSTLGVWQPRSARLVGRRV